MTRAEFLALLDAVHATTVVGIAPEELFPRDEEQCRMLLDQGADQLERNGLLGSDLQLLPDVLRLARAIVNPQLVFLVIRHVQALGSQLFLFYISQEGIVEQTFPAERIHRLVELSAPATLLSRVVGILSLPEQLAIKSEVDITQDEFFQCVALAQQPQQSQGLEILRCAGMPFLEAEALVTALAESEFRGEVALLKCINQTIVDARDIAVIQGRKTAWSVMQKIPGQPLLRVGSVDSSCMYSLLARCSDEFVRTGV